MAALDRRVEVRLGHGRRVLDLVLLRRGDTARWDDGQARVPATGALRHLGATAPARRQRRGVGARPRGARHRWFRHRPVHAHARRERVDVPHDVCARGRHVDHRRQRRCDHVVSHGRVGQPRSNARHGARGKHPVRHAWLLRHRGRGDRGRRRAGAAARALRVPVHAARTARAPLSRERHHGNAAVDRLCEERPDRRCERRFVRYPVRARVGARSREHVGQPTRERDAHRVRLGGNLVRDRERRQELGRVQHPRDVQGVRLPEQAGSDERCARARRDAAHLARRDVGVLHSDGHGRRDARGHAVRDVHARARDAALWRRGVHRDVERQRRRARARLENRGPRSRRARSHGLRARRRRSRDGDSSSRRSDHDELGSDRRIALGRLDHAGARGRARGRRATRARPHGAEHARAGHQ